MSLTVPKFPRISCENGSKPTAMEGNGGRGRANEKGSHEDGEDRSLVTPLSLFARLG
jgi:hypothetical protein